MENIRNFIDVDKKNTLQLAYLNFKGLSRSLITKAFDVIILMVLILYLVLGRKKNEIWLTIIIKILALPFILRMFTRRIWGIIRTKSINPVKLKSILRKYTWKKLFTNKNSNTIDKYTTKFLEKLSLSK